MVKKVFLIIVVLLCLQLINSCRCPDPATYEIKYKSISLTAWNTSGFQPTEVNDTVHKNAFGLELLIDFEQKQIAKNEILRDLFVFNTVYAFSCPEDEYIYIDSIDYVEIFVTDIETSETREITPYFGTYDYGGLLISLNEFFENRAIWHDGFQFDLITYNSIPNSSIFTVDLYLESGIKLTNQTNQINFFD